MTYMYLINYPKHNRIHPFRVTIFKHIKKSSKESVIYPGKKPKLLYDLRFNLHYFSFHLCNLTHSNPPLPLVSRNAICTSNTPHHPQRTEGTALTCT